jgi:hypothetical protein
VGRRGKSGEKCEEMGGKTKEDEVEKAKRRVQFTIICIYMFVKGEEVAV